MAQLINNNFGKSMFSEIKSLTRRTTRDLIRRCGYELTPVHAALPKEVKADYEPLLEILGSYRFKFLDVKTFLPLTMSRAHFIGIHESKGLQILDLGTGVGYFPVVCKYYGHSATALDQNGNQVFEDVTKWLNVDRRIWKIQAFQPLPDLGKRFDLITAFMVNFDRSEAPEYKPWTTPEWDFFLADLVHNHLKPGGRLVMLLNDHTLEMPSVLEHFAKRGAEVNGPWVDFKTLCVCS